MLINLRNALMTGKRLPYDAEVEYLESTGTQWIGLPFGFDRTDEVVARINCSGTGTSDYYVVSTHPWNQNNNRYALGVHGADGVYRLYCFGFGENSTSRTVLTPRTYNDRKMHTWIYANSVCSIPELQTSIDVSGVLYGSTSTNVRLFFGYNSATSAQIAKYKHIKNGVVFCDLIAVRLTNGNGQSVGAMYDKRGVGGMNGDGTARDDGLYFNRGAYAFVIGPDKSAANGGGGGISANA